jgi:hypothetical protein
MPTKNGVKQRPEFVVVEWRDLGTLATAPTVPALEPPGKPVEPVSLKEELNDEIPSFEDPPSDHKAGSKRGRKKLVPPV